MNKYSKYIVFAFVIFGSCIGMTILTPRFNVSQDTGILLGMVLGFLVAMFIPNLRKSFYKTVETEHQEAVEQNRYISFRETITHPTHLPMGIAITWLFAIIGIKAIFNLQIPEKTLFLLAFSPMSLALLVSGLIMIRKRELITGGWFGYVIKRTRWAIVLGILLIIMSIVSGIVFILD